MIGLLGMESLATHAAGLRMKTDVEQGYWFSKSNRELLGVTGVEIGLTARADDPQSETNRLNEKGIRLSSIPTVQAIVCGVTALPVSQLLLTSRTLR